jgi:hypothetical protein
VFNDFRNFKDFYLNTMQFNKHNAKKKHGTKNPNVHKQISGM